LNPKQKVVKFRPLNVFCQLTLVILYENLFDLQNDMFGLIFVVIITLLMFPPFEEEKKKTD